MLSLDDVVVQSLVDIVESFIAALMLVENNFKFCAALLKFLYFLLLADHLFAILLLGLADRLQ